MKQPRTLAARIFLLTAIWAIFATALIAWLISQNYRAGAEANLVDRLEANLYNIMGSISQNEDGRLVGRPDLRDSRFQAFQSGYYWSVVEVKDKTNQISSGSLVGEAIAVPPAVNFDDDFQREFQTTDSVDNELAGIEAQAFLGDGDNLYSFKITGNRSEIDSQVNAFIRQLLLLLALFALGFILVTYFIVRIGLAPLRQATESLSDIRDGRAERLEGKFPLEIQPFIEETNSLIVSNKTVVDRARTQVGNLAHSLKTPLAVLRNEGAKTRPELRTIIEEQVTQMQSQVQTYLDRARIASRAGTITSRTKVEPVLERLIRVMKKLNPQLDFSLETVGAKPYIFAGEQQDFEEMLGNLIENACKFAQTSVVTNLETVGDQLIVTIEDDGKGMPETEIQRALERGMRLDETKPGSGLGLSIVKDIAGEYGGEITLSTSKLGGLCARLALPGAKQNSKTRVQ